MREAIAKNLVRPVGSGAVKERAKVLPDKELPFVFGQVHDLKPLKPHCCRLKQPFYPVQDVGICLQKMAAYCFSSADSSSYLFLIQGNQALGKRQIFGWNIDPVVWLSSSRKAVVVGHPVIKLFPKQHRIKVFRQRTNKDAGRSLKFNQVNFQIIIACRQLGDQDDEFVVV